MPAERETSNALVLVWERGTPWITERDTAQTETERALTRLVTAPSLDSRLYPSKRSVAHTIHALIVSSCVVSSRVLRRPHQGPCKSPHFAQKPEIQVKILKLEKGFCEGRFSDASELSFGFSGTQKQALMCFKR